MLDFERIRRAKVQNLPYPFFIVAGAFLGGSGAQAAEAFPAIDRPGVIAAHETSHGEPFDEFLAEIEGDRFRSLITEKLEVDLAEAPTVVNVRGQARWTDGNIHTDSPTKAVTVLFYFNDEGEAPGTGLRILKGPSSLDDYVAEVPPTLGHMLAFKVTDNCWHGHPPFVGQRRSLQLNYLSGVVRSGKHQRARRFASHLSRRVGRLFG
ncbi:MAG: 2OG-Fe(II) oxygenase [Sphingomicrobium sp.]